MDNDVSNFMARMHQHSSRMMQLMKGICDLVAEAEREMELYGKTSRESGMQDEILSGMENYLEALERDSRQAYSLLERGYYTSDE